MVTKRKKSKAIARQGVNYVRSVVESNNCIFQEIDLENDIGSDALIEFISGEDATGVCIAVQIKSGNSYIDKNKGVAYLHGDKDHFEYWDKHVLPIAGIVYNPQDNIAVWCDIKDYLNKNHEAVQSGPYRIPIDINNAFCGDTIVGFIKYFLDDVRRFQVYDNFGKALEYFSQVDNQIICLQGIKSLFFHHRNRKATWYYYFNSFKYIEDFYLKRQLAIIFSYIPGHQDIYWHKGNIIDRDVREHARVLLRSYLEKDWTIKLLSCVDEKLFQRGSIGQCIHAILDQASNPANLMESIFYDNTVDEFVRYVALILLINYRQSLDIEKCFEYVNEFLAENPHSSYNSEILEIKVLLEEYGYIGLY